MSDYEVVERPVTKHGNCRPPGPEMAGLIEALVATVESGKALRLARRQTSMPKIAWRYLRTRGYKLRTRGDGSRHCIAWCERLTPNGQDAPR